MLHNWKECNGIELQGQRPDLLIKWGGRKPKTWERWRGQSQRHGGTSVVCAENNGLRGWDFKIPGSLSVHFGLQLKRMEGRLADVYTRFPAKYSETLLGQHGDAWVCQSYTRCFLANVMNNTCPLQRECLKFYLRISMSVVLGRTIHPAQWSLMGVLKTACVQHDCRCTNDTDRITNSWSLWKTAYNIMHYMSMDSSLLVWQGAEQHPLGTVLGRSWCTRGNGKHDAFTMLLKYYLMFSEFLLQAFTHVLLLVIVLHIYILHFLLPGRIFCHLVSGCTCNCGIFGCMKAFRWYTGQSEACGWRGKGVCQPPLSVPVFES